MNLHHRRSIRLPGYDYTSEGSYFVTLVTHCRIPLFGKIVNDEMILNDLGRIVREEWLKSAALRLEIELVDDEFVVMPNHFHGIINIIDHGWGTAFDHGREITVGAHAVGATGRSPQRKPVTPTKPNGPKPKSLGALIAGFKSSVTTRINIYATPKARLSGSANIPNPSRKKSCHVIHYEDH